MARMTVVALMEIGPVYRGDVRVGVLQSVV